MKSLWAWVGLSIAAWCVPLPVNGAASDTVPQEGPIAGLYFENDLFVGDDANYTDGVRLAWMSGTTSDNNTIAATLGVLGGGTQAPAAWRRFTGMERSALLRQQWGISLTQLMFTPETRSTSPVFGEHPYAGHLALGISSLVKDDNRANVWELQVGTTGSSSFAKGSQHFIHKLWGMEQWPGWRTQIPGEFTANLYFKRYYRLQGLEFSHAGGYGSDGLLYWHADAGTVKVQSGVGMLVRYGYNLANTSSPENYIHGATPMAAPFVYTRTNGSPWSYYAYLQAAVRLVAHDLYLDGPVFHHYPHYVDKFPCVGEWSAGVALRYKRTDFLFGLQFNTREYLQQRGVQCTGTFQVRCSF